MATTLKRKKLKRRLKNERGIDDQRGEGHREAVQAVRYAARRALHLQLGGRGLVVSSNMVVREVE